MKKIVSLCAIAAVALLQACTKEEKIGPQHSRLQQDSVEKRSSITILSPENGDMYSEGSYVNVTWKTKNVPEGVMIVARFYYLNDSGSGIGVALVPQEEVATSVKGTTRNDGQEVFRLPIVNTLRSGSMIADYGKHFRIDMGIVVLDHNGIWREQNTYYQIPSPIFTVRPAFPAGCSSVYGYSTTTGQPCSVPVLH